MKPATMPSHATADLHLGYRPDEMASSRYVRFFNPVVAPMQSHVNEAILTGAVAHELMPTLASAPRLAEPGYWPVETGYTQTPDGARHVFVLTKMPRVTPAMWDWWFAWHGSEAQRYKLWHPQAHIHVAWADGRSDLQHYVGRTSNVVEFVGPNRLDLRIRFVHPSELGLDEGGLAARGEVAICARGSLAGTPMETGWLVHHVRPVAGGAEMRSRFWMAGNNIRPRGMPGPAGALIGRVAARFAPLTANTAVELLVHCAQEMNHLAGILPELHKAFGPQAR